MFAFILRRLLQAVIVMVAVAFIAFMLFQYVGDPVVFLLGQDAQPDQIAQLRADLGLDKPFFVQFGHFLVNAAQGEFGLSLRQGRQVSALIVVTRPNSGLRSANGSSIEGSVLKNSIPAEKSLRTRPIWPHCGCWGSTRSLARPCRRA